MRNIFESYIEAVTEVCNGESEEAYCIVKDYKYNEHQAIQVKFLGGAVPSNTIIMTGSREECESAIRRINEKS